LAAGGVAALGGGGGLYFAANQDVDDMRSGKLPLNEANANGAVTKAMIGDGLVATGALLAVGAGTTLLIDLMTAPNN
jgi:hypothetical protein